MKKVVSGKQLREKMKESINYLCDIVSNTLGPKGSNVIIDHSLFTPFITNDGATIARNIESEDEVVNTILEIAKEASLKTNEIVGDGTTTTLVLLKSIFNTSLQYIENEKNPMVLKKELNVYLQTILKRLEMEKRNPSEEDFFRIASIAANDEDLGKLASDAFLVVQNKNAITIKEIEENKMNVQFINGYNIETQLASDYFLKEQKSVNFLQTCVLIIHDCMHSLENIGFILNDCIKTKKNLVIFASDFDEDVIREMVSLTLENELHCCVLKLSTYGMHQRKLEKDLEVLTNAKIIDNYNYITPENIGFCKNILVTNESVRLDFMKNNQIKKYISLLESESKECKEEYEKNFYQKRMAMFQTGLVTIEIGAPTKTECHEKKMRLEDALCALESCKHGVILGGGVTLLKIASTLEEQKEASTIFKNALQEPFAKIISNAGLDFSSIYEDIKQANYQKIYNVKKEQLEDIQNTFVLDSLDVVVSSLINATSIATMLLTTTSLVINEYQNNMSKSNEYTEI